jgi:hypothetical protein
MNDAYTPRARTEHLFQKRAQCHLGLRDRESMQVDFRFDAILAAAQFLDDRLLYACPAEGEVITGFGKQVTGREPQALLQHGELIEASEARPRPRLGRSHASGCPQSLDVADGLTEQPFLLRIIVHRMLLGSLLRLGRLLCPLQALPV